MALKEMNFKGRKVFVEVTEGGELVLENGRAVMRYRPDDEKTYGPWPTNLSEIDGETVTAAPAAKKTTAKKTTAKKTAKNPAPAPEGAIVAYTDGACLGNPGPSGLGYAVVFPDGRRVQAGEPLGQGTNNIAELTAIGRVLEIVEPGPGRLIIHTDSSYSIGVLTQGWKAKANRELIAGIKRAMGRFPGLELRKVKGHAGIPENELVDDLAREAATVQRRVE